MEPLPLNYAPAKKFIAAERPGLGWFSLLLPTMTAVISWPIGLLILSLLGPFLSMAVMVACIFWSWSIGKQVAAWHYSVKVIAAEKGAGIEPPANYEKRLRALLFALQVIGIMLSWLPLGIFIRLSGLIFVDV